MKSEAIGHVSCGSAKGTRGTALRRALGVSCLQIVMLLPGPAANPAGLRQSSAPAQDQSADRFDMQVRGDMFSGLAGDGQAMERAMKLCEQALEKDPKNSQALVWHGSGLVFQAGRLFRTGDYLNGKALLIRGLKQMDDAVSLAPESVAVLIPRGASLLSYAAHSSDPQRARPRLEMGLADYEKVLAIQKPEWAQLPAHSRGELLSALAAGWLQAGDAAKARSYAQRIGSELPGSRYAARAHAFLADATPPAHLDWPCLGCHASSAHERAR